MFQVMIFIGLDSVLPDAGAHEALHELPLEQQEGNEQRARRHQRGGADHRPVDALVGRGEDGEADGEGRVVTEFVMISGQR